jgi:hypothetical protein
MASVSTHAEVAESRLEVSLKHFKAAFAESVGMVSSVVGDAVFCLG